MAASQHDVGMIVGLQAITSADVVAKLLVFETGDPEIGVGERNRRILIQLLCQDFQRVGAQTIVGIRVGDVFAGSCPNATIPGLVNVFSLLSSDVLNIGVLLLKARRTIAPSFSGEPLSTTTISS